MISLLEAQDIVLENVITTSAEEVTFSKALQRILAEDIISDIDMPPFNKSAVDGYACRIEDINDELLVVDTIPAGVEPDCIIYKGQCAKIMTGGMMPVGATTVLMVEHTEITGKDKIKFNQPKTSPNFCKKGEDVAVGQVVLSKGTKITPANVAVLASVGKVFPMVAKLPRVGVLSTGNELVEPFEKPQGSQIRNSNSYQLLAQLANIGIEGSYLGIIPDNPKDSKLMLEKAMQTNDVVILSGGVSMGDFDYIPKAMKDIGIDLKFETIAIQPGKPTVFGVKENKYFFGLPGNPVSSFVLFEIMVKSLLLRIQGCTQLPENTQMQLGFNYKRNSSQRQGLVPVKFLPSGVAIPISYNGSAHIHSLCFADGLMYVPIGTTELERGDWVDVRRF